MTETPLRGVGARRRRLSDQESADRMISAASEMIRESGLTVSLEHISIEDVIRRADVSRTAAYRRWKYKDEFFADLLRELASDPHPAVISGPSRRYDLEGVTEHLDWVRTPSGRARLHAEAMRAGGAVDLANLATSHRWRSYIALQAAALSLADGDFRTELQGILAESERQIHRRLATNYAAIADLAGFRIRPDAAVTYEDIAIMCSAAMNGVAVKAQSDPNLLAHTVGMSAQLDPGGEWSLAAAACFAIQTYYLEPDPDVTWDAQRIATVQDVLRRLATFLSTGDHSVLAQHEGLRRLLGV